MANVLLDDSILSIDYIMKNSDQLNRLFQANLLPENETKISH